METLTQTHAKVRSKRSVDETTLLEGVWEGGFGGVDGGVGEAPLNTAVWYSLFLIVRLPIIESKVAVPDVIQ